MQMGCGSTNVLRYLFSLPGVIRRESKDHKGSAPSIRLHSNGRVMRASVKIEVK